MRFVIYGTGGVGGYFGARLAEAGEDVAFIARGEHLRAMRDKGLRVASVNGDFVVSSPEVSDDPASLEHADCIVLAVKTWQIEDALAAMRPLVGADTVILPLENGVEALDLITAAYGGEHALGGLCKILAWRQAPGEIVHGGVDPVICLGERDNQRSARLDAISAALARAAGITVQVPDDIQAAIWSKFLFICAMSGIGSITRMPIGATRSDPACRQMIVAILEEIEQVAAARGVALGAQAIDKAVQFIDALPAAGTASMQRDIEAGRPSELASQTGAVVRLGREHGVETPVNAFIHTALAVPEAHARTA